LHERTAIAIESFYAEQLDDHSGDLARRQKPRKAAVGSARSQPVLGNEFSSALLLLPAHQSLDRLPVETPVSTHPKCG
jgi:hypothetical protein